MNRPSGLPILRRLRRVSSRQEIPAVPLATGGVLPEPVQSRLLPPGSELPLGTAVGQASVLLPVQLDQEMLLPAAGRPAPPATAEQPPLSQRPSSLPTEPPAEPPFAETESSAIDDSTWARLKTIFNRHQQTSVQTAQEPNAQAAELPQLPPPDELPTQPLPLETIWPVQRVPEPASATEPPPALSDQPLDAQLPTDDKEPDRMRTILQTIAPAQPTDSHVELIHPRTPRPARPPDSRVSARLQPPAPDSSLGKTAIQRTPEFAPQTIDTPIGTLPADLWPLINELPPVQRDTAVEQTASEETRRAQTVKPQSISPTSSERQSRTSPPPAVSPPRPPTRDLCVRFNFREPVHSRKESALF